LRRRYEKLSAPLRAIPLDERLRQIHIVAESGAGAENEVHEFGKSRPSEWQWRREGGREGGSFTIEIAEDDSQKPRLIDVCS